MMNGKRAWPLVTLIGLLVPLVAIIQFPYAEGLLLPISPTQALTIFRTSGTCENVRIPEESIRGLPLAGDAKILQAIDKDYVILRYLVPRDADRKLDLSYDEGYYRYREVRWDNSKRAISLGPVRENSLQYFGSFNHNVFLVSRHAIEFDVPCIGTDSCTFWKNAGLFQYAYSESNFGASLIPWYRRSSGVVYDKTQSIRLEHFSRHPTSGPFPSNLSGLTHLGFYAIQGEPWGTVKICYLK